jgi:hypothetical protein
MAGFGFEPGSTAKAHADRRRGLNGVALKGMVSR